MAASGVQVVENAGTIDRFERCATGVRLTHSTSDGQHSIDATLAVVAVGWAAAARENREVVAATVRFDSLPRPIIDGRRTGFCKLIVDRELHTIMGRHVVGERAVELAQLAATATAAKMPVEELALVPFSFPTYANALGRAAILVAIELDQTGIWAVDHLETAVEAGLA